MSDTLVMQVVEKSVQVEYGGCSQRGELKSRNRNRRQFSSCEKLIELTPRVIIPAKREKGI